VIKPVFTELNELLGARHDHPAVWTLHHLAGRVREKFPYKMYEFPTEPAKDHDFLLVVGGGMLIDYAKVWRQTTNPSLPLAVIPSIWGSGAENSGIAIINTENEKIIHNGAEYLPDVRSIWPEIARDIPEDLALYACGDTWAHALEGFLSPLAGDDLRVELAELLRALSRQRIGNDPAWFQLSAQANAGQSRSSVGFIHGIAHTLEPILKNSADGQVYGHARLCSLYAWPVFRMNRSSSEKVDTLLETHHLDANAIEEKLKTLFSVGDFNRLLPVVEENWMKILRNPLTRTNCVLIRPGSFEQFRDWGRS
jgi:alcohol dehydrogenase class IV